MFGAEFRKENAPASRPAATATLERVRKQNPGLDKFLASTSENSYCMDCGEPRATWASVNLGELLGEVGWVLVGHDSNHIYIICQLYS